jgi:hypothetical protein
MPRSGSSYFCDKMDILLNEISQGEYNYLVEYFNAHAIRTWFSQEPNNDIIEQGKIKPGAIGSFRWKYVYENNKIAKHQDCTSLDNFDESKETAFLIKIWNEMERSSNQKYFLKLFLLNLRESPRGFFMKHMNTHENLFMIILRKDFRKMILSNIIARDIDKWAYVDKTDAIFLPEKSSIVVDMAEIDYHLKSIEEFYESIAPIHNKCIINYDYIEKPETTFFALQQICAEDAFNHDIMDFKKINDSITIALIPTPYTMEHIDYIKNKDEVLSRLNGFSDKHNYYMDLYNIK